MVPHYSYRSPFSAFVAVLLVCAQFFAAMGVPNWIAKRHANASCAGSQCGCKTIADSQRADCCCSKVQTCCSTHVGISCCSSENKPLPIAQLKFGARSCKGENSPMGYATLEPVVLPMPQSMRCSDDLRERRIATDDTSPTRRTLPLERPTRM